MSQVIQILGSSCVSGKFSIIPSFICAKTDILPGNSYLSIDQKAIPVSFMDRFRSGGATMI